MSEQAERLARGEWYLDDEMLRERRRACWRLLDRYNVTGADDDEERSRLLATMLGSVGEGVVVMPRFQCSYGTHITLGRDVFVNAGAFLMDDAPIHLGAHTRVGPGAQLMTALHPVEDHDRRRDGWERALPIMVGENVWLGANVVVGAGVSIGANTVVGAGSTVLRDLPDHVVAVGSPASVVRSTAPEGPARH